MKVFVSAQLTDDVMTYLKRYAQVKLGGWGATGHVLTPEELVGEAKDCEMMIICYEKMTDFVFQSLPQLKFVSCTRGGMENFDRSVVQKYPHVMICNAPGRNANAVADLTVGLMLDISRNISLSSHYIRNRDWEHAKWFKAGMLGKKLFMGYELDGKCLGLIGLGEIGRRVARRVEGFGMKVLAYDPYCKDGPDGVELTELDTLLHYADYVSLHCKVTDETKHIICASTIGLMKPTAFLINTARGALIQEEDLYTALKERWIEGAALDTLESEPIPETHPFLTLENIVITPHIGGASYDIVSQQSKIVFEDICAYIEGRRPAHVWP